MSGRLWRANNAQELFVHAILRMLFYGIVGAIGGLFWIVAGLPGSVDHLKDIAFWSVIAGLVIQIATFVLPADSPL